ncbi:MULTISPECIES: fumarylacetoacetate hydrolase family protein [unclassified Rhodococcus (in: high G+C Gram-positive bacteria)]|uniref:fumarylacetoacetate hydrolase family protein n=1 Tax=unclassified Rhodococcus (in: high G+C Gram-positive bacteria) TaxID=192944 RepID=UPI001C52AEBE|nr:MULTISPECIES: fumarylacetoacetate hydrolase family protein [unclassified Rhodococcus (in: high G+C Gram-positive bacteria)]
MRFVNFSDTGRPRVGLVEDGVVFGLDDGIRIVDLLGDDHAKQLRAAGNRARAHPSVTLDLAEADLLAPIPAPPTVRDYMTFEQHVAGVARLVDEDSVVPEQWYKAPAFYFTNPYAVIGPYDPVAVPPGCELFDFELEIAAVVGRSGRDVLVADADSHIAGYMVMNDWSARDLQFAEMQVRLGPVKGKDSATSLGPYFVTADELEPHRAGNAFDLKMSASVNDVVVGEDNWANMAFSYPQMLAYASRGTEVRAGDLLGSGTCGSGCLAEVWGRRGRSAIPPPATRRRRRARRRHSGGTTQHDRRDRRCRPDRCFPGSGL